MARDVKSKHADRGSIYGYAGTRWVNLIVVIYMLVCTKYHCIATVPLYGSRKHANVLGVQAGRDCAFDNSAKQGDGVSGTTSQTRGENMQASPGRRAKFSTKAHRLLEHQCIVR